MTTSDTTSEPVDNDVLNAAHGFLLQYGKDRESGVIRPLAEYQSMFPDFKDQIAHEYAVIAGDEVGVAKDASQPAVESVGHYTIISELGHGGQGVVYLAEDTRVHRKVALKVLSSHAFLSPGSQKRFRREAETASRLHHPGICTVYEAGEIEGVSFIAMQHVEGESLSRMIADARAHGGRILDRSSAGEDRAGSDWDDVVSVVALIERAARTVHTAHESGVIHRDLKPGNIMVTPEGRPVILDFGLARDDDSETLTRAGDFLGTPAYAAPEVVRGDPRPADTRSDVYALGVTLYECLTLSRPFEAPTREALYRKILSEDVSRASRHNEAIPSDLELVLATAMEKNPDRRYQTALALAEDLECVRKRQPIHARPIPAALRARRWLQRNPLLATTLLTLTLGVVVSLLLLASREEALHRVRVMGLVGASAQQQAQDPQRALLLAIRAAGLEENHDTISQLFTAVANSNERATFKNPDPRSQRGLTGAAISPDATRVVSVNASGIVRLFHVDDPENPVKIDLRRRLEEWRIKPPDRPEILIASAPSFSPKGDRFAVAARDGEVYVFDQNGRLTTRLPHETSLGMRGPKRYRQLVAFCPDGDRILTGSSGGVARLWRVDGKLIYKFPEHERRISHVTFSPNGKQMATASHDGTARVWNVDGPPPFQQAFPALKHEHKVDWVCFSPTGDHVASVGRGTRMCRTDGTRRRWKPSRGAWAAAFKPKNARALLTFGGQQVAKIWQPKTDVTWKTFRQDCGLAMASFSPDGSMIVTAGADQAARIFDVVTSRAFAVLRGHHGTLISAVFTTDGRQVLTASNDGTARLWDIDVPEFGVLRLASPVFSFDISTRDRVVVGCKNSELWLYEAGERSGTGLRTGKGYPFWVVRFGKHGQVVAGTENGLLWRRDANGSVVKKELDSFVRDADFARDQGSVWVAGDNGLYRVFMDDRSSKCLERARLGCVAVHPRSNLLATGSLDGAVHLRSSVDGRTVALVGTHRAWVTAVSFSRDGSRLVTASRDGTACLWDVERRTLVSVLHGHHGRVTSACFSPTGDRILTASFDGTAKVWDLDGQVQFTLRGHRGILHQARFSPDGRKIVTGGSDRTVRFWPACIKRLREIARERRIRALSLEERERYADLLSANGSDKSL